MKQAKNNIIKLQEMEEQHEDAADLLVALAAIEERNRRIADQLYTDAEKLRDSTMMEDKKLRLSMLRTAQSLDGTQIKAIRHRADIRHITRPRVFDT